MVVNVKLENFHNLECFRNILDKYRDYKSIYRELKINSVLGNKSELEINDIIPPIMGVVDDNSSIFINLNNVTFIINSMIFTIDKDLNVIKILLDIKILETFSNILSEKTQNEIENLIDFRLILLYSYDYYEITGFQACSKESKSIIN
jgi:hypothetical protein